MFKLDNSFNFHVFKTFWIYWEKSPNVILFFSNAILFLCSQVDLKKCINFLIWHFYWFFREKSFAWFNYSTLIWDSVFPSIYKPFQRFLEFQKKVINVVKDILETFSESIWYCNASIAIFMDVVVYFGVYGGFYGLLSIKFSITISVSSNTFSRKPSIM